MRWLIGGTIAVGVFLFGGTAFAASEQALKDCSSDGFRTMPDRTIEACTAIIDDSTESAAHRAYAFFWRGRVWYAKGYPLDWYEKGGYTFKGERYHSRKETEYLQHAMADVDEVIRLDPKCGGGMGYALRAGLRKNMADYSRDFSEAMWKREEKLIIADNVEKERVAKDPDCKVIVDSLYKPLR